MTASSPHDALETHYANLEQRYKVVEESDYGVLVTANGNTRAPIHRWFRMKEAYSNKLLERILTDSGLAGREQLSIMDPFSGSGTTGVSAGDLVRDRRLSRASVTAIEVNPFLHLLSVSKMRAHTSTRKDVFQAAGRVARRAMSEMDGLAPVPELSTFSKAEYFPSKNLDRLRAIKASVDALDEDDSLRDFLTIALAAAVEPSSNLRRDGRALRLSAGKACDESIDVFLDVAGQIAEDLTLRSVNFEADVRRADARDDIAGISADHDLSLFSPPYPNNIDYTEVYKMEGWFLGLYGSATEFSDQRRQTLRSHSSLRWGRVNDYVSGPHAAEIDALLQPVMQAVPGDRYRRGREEVVAGYVDDMLSVIRLVRRGLRPGGMMAIAVGNSMHGKQPDDYVIASDLLLARLAELEGFVVQSIQVGRYPKRRTSRSRYLRESVVFARKE